MVHPLQTESGLSIPNRLGMSNGPSSNPGDDGKFALMKSGDALTLKLIMLHA